jgi:hypothetical protein
MKFKCIEIPIETNRDFTGIRKGRIYKGQIIYNGMSDISLSAWNWNEVIIFNDKKEWHPYPLKCFKPY